MSATSTLGWIGIVRLGLVQTALGAVVVLTTSTLNRVMVVELALPAMLPAALVGLYYAVQLLRPRWGYGSDVGGRRTPWILGGMATLALGGLGAALATVWAATQPLPGLLLGTAAFFLIGAGSGAAGTSLLALLATHVAPQRRAAAASITWMMMIAGFVVTTALVGHFLDPFSGERLIVVAAVCSGAAFLLAALAVIRLERRRPPLTAEPRTAKVPFRQALREVLAESTARRFTVFVFLSMLAYSMQDLILEPFAGLVFAMTPGQSTQLASFQHGGVLIGMLVVALAGSRFRASRFGSRQGWVIAGCLASAVALLLLATGAMVGGAWPLKANAFLLGLANGAFAVAAIAVMMGLAGTGQAKREGMRMGLWGAAQAISFGIGGFLGAAALDLTRSLFPTPGPAFALVFAVEALLFMVAAQLAVGIDRRERRTPAAGTVPVGLATAEEV